MIVTEENYDTAKHTAKVFVLKYRIDYEEALSIAYEHMVKAIDDYSEEKGTNLTTYIITCIRRGFYSYFYKEKRHSNLREKWKTKPPKSKFDINSFLFELSDDARILCNLIICPPKIIPPKPPIQLRQSVTRFVKDEMEWTSREIRKGYKEIKETLSEKI